MEMWKVGLLVQMAIILCQTEQRSSRVADVQRQRVWSPSSSAKNKTELRSMKIVIRGLRKRFPSSVRYDWLIPWAIRKGNPVMKAAA